MNQPPLIRPESEERCVNDKGGVAPPKSPIVRALLTLVLNYLGYLMMMPMVVVWTAVTLVIIAFFSQDALVILLHLAVERGGELFGPLLDGGRIVFDSNFQKLGEQDISGRKAAMHIFGWGSLALYLVGSLLGLVFRKEFSVEPGTKLKFIFLVSLAAFMAIMLSYGFAKESGIAPDSIGILFFLSLAASAVLFLSGMWSVLWNVAIRKILDDWHATGDKAERVE